MLLHIDAHEEGGLGFTNKALLDQQRGCAPQWSLWRQSPVAREDEFCSTRRRPCVKSGTVKSAEGGLDRLIALRYRWCRHIIVMIALLSSSRC